MPTASSGEGLRISWRTNGCAGVPGDALIAAPSFTVQDGVIAHVHSVANPDKLAHVRRALERAARD